MMKKTQMSSVDDENNHDFNFLKLILSCNFSFLETNIYIFLLSKIINMKKMEIS